MVGQYRLAVLSWKQEKGGDLSHLRGKKKGRRDYASFRHRERRTLRGLGLLSYGREISLALLLPFSLASCIGPTQLTLKPNDRFQGIGTQIIEEDVAQCRQRATASAETNNPKLKTYILAPLISTGFVGIASQLEYGTTANLQQHPHFNGVLLTSAAVLSVTVAIVSGIAYFRAAKHYWHVYDEYLGMCLIERGYELNLQ